MPKATTRIAPSSKRILVLLNPKGDALTALRSLTQNAGLPRRVAPQLLNRNGLLWQWNYDHVSSSRWDKAKPVVRRRVAKLKAEGVITGGQAT